MQTLQPNATLQGGKYIINKVLGQGGFGITYLAEQTMLGRKVAIKEFFLKQFCERDEATSQVTVSTTISEEVARYERKFLKEAQSIASFSHPNIIKVHDVFKENNTTYYVMEFIEGESLSAKMKSRDGLTETESVGYIRQVGAALDYIHSKHINHLDVKPSNILVRSSDDQIILIDFGTSKQYDANTGGATSTTPVGVSYGYAPLEQYKPGGVAVFTPQADIYALGATLYSLLTGKIPPQAIDILNDGFPDLPSSITLKTQKTIRQAMSVKKDDRQNSVGEFLKMLDEEPNLIKAQTSEETVPLCNYVDDGQPQMAKQISFSVKGVSFEMVRVEAGTFTMGATAEQLSDAYEDEKPAHLVSLSTYFIGKTEVTQALWKAVMGNNPSQYRGAKLPVENVSWKDCQEFVKKLREMTGKGFRMPTEAEWEFAARGGNLSKGYKYAGSNSLEEVAWFTNNSGSGILDVAKKQPNELGLYDMSGNVFEWCSDFYSLFFYSESQLKDPKGPANGESRVLRGGSWNTIARGCRSSFRFDDAPDSNRVTHGFRLALSE